MLHESIESVHYYEFLPYTLRVLQWWGCTCKNWRTGSINNKNRKTLYVYCTCILIHTLTLSISICQCGLWIINKYFCRDPFEKKLSVFEKRNIAESDSRSPVICIISSSGSRLPDIIPSYKVDVRIFWVHGWCCGSSLPFHASSVLLNSLLHRVQ